MSDTVTVSRGPMGLRAPRDDAPTVIAVDGPSWDAALQLAARYGWRAPTAAASWSLNAGEAGVLAASLVRALPDDVDVDVDVDAGAFSQPWSEESRELLQNVIRLARTGAINVTRRGRG
ncbi:MAG: hypothetical protein WKG32_12985 [Gemmatimonadaceae bacterium]